MEKKSSISLASRTIKDTFELDEGESMHDLIWCKSRNTILM